MRRRAFIAALGAAVAAAGWRSTFAADRRKIGLISAGPPQPGSPLLGAFTQRLRELGYRDERSLLIEERYANGDLRRLPKLIAELVDLKVEVIVTAGPDPTRAAKAATSKIPIVMVSGSADPIAEGLIASYARPGGNVTGTTYAVSPERIGKQLDLLKQTIGRIARVAVLWDLDLELFRQTWKPILDRAAAQLGVQIIGPFVVREVGDFDRAFADIARAGGDGVLAASGGVIFANRTRVGELALLHRLPTISAFKDLTQAGLLMSYGPDFSENYRRAAVYVDRILKGADPASLPVEQPTKHQFAVNLKTARALAVTIPDWIVASADEVIE